MWKIFPNILKIFHPLWVKRKQWKLIWMRRICGQRKVYDGCWLSGYIFIHSWAPHCIYICCTHNVSSLGAGGGKPPNLPRSYSQAWSLEASWGRQPQAHEIHLGRSTFSQCAKNFCQRFGSQCNWAEECSFRFWRELSAWERVLHKPGNQDVWAATVETQPWWRGGCQI